MIKLKPLIISILIPLILGFFGSFLGDFSKSFEFVNKPTFSPPAVLFPVVWIILYILMGISSYLIYMSNSKNKKTTLTFYGIQLLLNIIWPLFFFRFNWFLLSFWWVILIILFLMIMIYMFYRIKPIAAYLQIPYLLWLIFASILNYSIYLLN